MRIHQEIMLGIGGVQMLKALGLVTMNEGMQRFSAGAHPDVNSVRGSELYRR